MNSISENETIEASDKINRQLNLESVSPYPADLADHQKITKSIQDFANKNDGLDIFVANAGITVFKSFLDVGIDEFDHLMNVNMRGT